MLRHLLNSFRVILALSLAVTPAASQEFFPSYGFVLGVGGGPAPDTTPTIFVATCVADSANATTYTFNGITFTGLGDADTVMVLVGIIGEDSATNFSLASATIEGAAASEVEDSASVSTGSLVISGFYRSGNITGAASVDVTVTFSEAITSAAVCLWASRNEHSDLTANVADSAFQTSSASLDPGCGGGSGITGDFYTISANSATGVTATTDQINEREDVTTGEADYSNADIDNTELFPSQATIDWSGTADAIGSCVAF